MLNAAAGVSPGKTSTSCPRWTAGTWCWTRWGGRAVIMPRSATSTPTMSSCAWRRSAKMSSACSRRWVWWCRPRSSSNAAVCAPMGIWIIESKGTHFLLEGRPTWFESHLVLSTCPSVPLGKTLIAAAINNCRLVAACRCDALSPGNGSRCGIQLG